MLTLLFSILILSLVYFDLIFQIFGCLDLSHHYQDIMIYVLLRAVSLRLILFMGQFLSQENPLLAISLTRSLSPPPDRSPG